tara:strand:- start:1273 stop:1524 length:252 start_codon:yes stop_codon:yes gene_type:complete
VGRILLTAKILSTTFFEILKNHQDHNKRPSIHCPFEAFQITKTRIGWVLLNFFKFSLLKVIKNASKTCKLWAVFHLAYRVRYD